jgi:lipopolysaccharide export system protein LptA
MIIIRIIISLLILLSGGKWSDLKASNPQPVHLQHADLMRTESTPQGTMRYLDGNVWITQDTLSITGDNAVYQEAVGQLVFTGHVHFVEPTRQMWADQATYFEKDGRATAQGNVRIEQDSMTITCQRAFYLEERKEVNMTGDVRIHSLKENAILTGGHGKYNRSAGFSAMEQDPRLLRYFTDDDSMVVTGELIEYFFDTEEAVVTNEVHVQRNDFEAWGDKLDYHNQGEWSRLIGRPILQRKMDTMQADTIDAFFKNKELQRVHLAGKAVATSPVDSLHEKPMNVITGRVMDLKFASGLLDSIQVQGNAASLYYVRQQEGESGANRVSGDVIKMKIEKGQVSWVYVEGGTEGVYFPSKLEGLAESDQPERSEPVKPRMRTSP